MTPVPRTGELRFARPNEEEGHCVLRTVEAQQTAASDRLTAGEEVFMVQPQLHPALAEFRTELERLGFVVVCHGSYLCVRLPLAASVRIHLNGTQLHFEPRFAMFSRGTSLVVTPTLAILAVAGVASVATIPAIIVTAFAGSLTVLYDLARLVMTENTTTRLQLLWTTRPPPGEVLPAGAGDESRLATTRTGPAPLGEGLPASAAERVTRSVTTPDRLRSGR